MNLFFAQEIINSTGALQADEAYHAFKVLRLTVDDEILVCEGKGEIWKARISLCSKKEVIFKTLELVQTEQPNGLHIAIAPTKSNDRFEFFLEKATEIGIARITPLLCHHSERKIYNIERGKKILKAAVKQSHRALLPQLDEMIPYNKFLQNLSSQNLYIAHLEKENKVDFYAFKGQNNALVLIGPEGDFSPEEIQFAKQLKAKALSMGNFTLRTETAGIAATLAWSIKS